MENANLKLSSPLTVLQTSRLQIHIKKHSVPEPNTGCWLWTRSVDGKGYGAITYAKKHQRAHRISYAAFKDIIPEGLYVCHKCDVRACVNPDHLFLGTLQENFKDMRLKGRSCKGSKKWSAKLTEEQVLAIRKDSRSSFVIGKEYGVSKVAIEMIKRRATWRHI